MFSDLLLSTWKCWSVTSVVKKVSDSHNLCRADNESSACLSFRTSV